MLPEVKGQTGSEKPSTEPEPIRTVEPQTEVLCVLDSGGQSIWGTRVPSHHYFCNTKKLIN